MVLYSHNNTLKKTMENKYQLYATQLADYENVCIVDNELEIVICHINVSGKLSFDEAVELGNKIVKSLNHEQ